MQFWPDSKFGWPEVIILPVTYFCNANCDMCALGELKQREHLEDDQLVDMFRHASISSTLRAINFTGGEPTVRRDLPQLIGRLIDVCPQLESFSINSNGMLPTSADTLRRAIDVGRERRLKVWVFISLDGIGGLHDEIRGVPGAYESTRATIEMLQGLGISSTELQLGVSATVTHKNIDHLGEVLKFAVDRNLLAAFTFPLVTDVYMANLERQEQFGGSPDIGLRFADFIDTLVDYERHVCPGMTFYRDLQSVLRGGNRSAGCLFRRGGFFLEPNGNVRPCWRASELLFGNIHENSFEEIWSGSKRERIIDMIEDKYCKTCPSNCYAGFKSRFVQTAQSGAL